MTMWTGPGMICLGTHKYAARLISNCTLQGREERRGRGAYRGDIMNIKGAGWEEERHYLCAHTGGNYSLTCTIMYMFAPLLHPHWLGVIGAAQATQYF